MIIYDFLESINDAYNIIFRLFNCETENLVFVSDDEDETDTDFTYDELLDSKYADLEYGSMDIWMDIERGKIFVEFNVDIAEDDFDDEILSYDC